MSKKSKEKKRLEIRVSDVPEKLYNSIKKRAEQEERSMGREILSTIKELY